MNESCRVEAAGDVLMWECSERQTGPQKNLYESVSFAPTNAVGEEEGQYLPPHALMMLLTSPTPAVCNSFAAVFTRCAPFDISGLRCVVL